jgi:hypothetical protein
MRGLLLFVSISHTICSFLRFADSLSQIPQEIGLKNNPFCYIFLRLKTKFNFYLKIKQAGKDAHHAAKGDILKPFETQISVKYLLRARLLLPKIHSADVRNMFGK